MPNGLQGYLLTDNKGKRIDKGPTDVVVDKEAVKRGRDPEVVNGVSCMNCHWSGMLNKVDQVRDHVLGQESAYSASVFEFVKAVYVEKPAFAAKLKEDRERFEIAVKKCGLSSLAKSEPVATLAFQFDEPLDLDLAAAEAGVSVTTLTAALKNNKALGRELGSLVLGQPVQRDTYVQLFGVLVKELKVGEFLSSIGTVPQVPNAGGAALFEGRMAGELRDDAGLNAKLVWCPPGRFTMGTPKSETGRQDDENQVDVTLTNGFWMGQTEVTQGLFQRVQGTAPWNGKTFVKEGPDYAASYVSHNDAVAFCAKLTSQERTAGRLPAGSVYRLPSEAEWEYACRAGTKTAYSFGDSASSLSDYAWFDKNAFDIGENYAHQVGLKKSNAWGLKDMHGNVWEWCGDWYAAKLPGGTDPRGPSAGSLRVCRGVSFNNYSIGTRVGLHHKFGPTRSDHYLGFRVVVSVE